MAGYRKQPRNSNLRMATRLYNYIADEGPKTTAQIKDWLNNDFRPTEARRTKSAFKYTVTSEQISGLMRTSPLFEAIGTQLSLGLKTTYETKVYDIVPVTIVVDKMLDDNGQLKKHRLKKRLPSVIRDELKIRGLKA